MKLQAWRRGTRELDMIFGTVMDRMVAEMSDVELCQMEALLSEPDLMVYDWIIGRTEIPQQHQHAMMKELQDFARLAATLQQGKSG